MDKLNVLKEDEIRPPKLSYEESKLFDKDLQILKRGKFVRVNCPACDSNKFRHLLTKKSFSFVSCNKCSMVFENPRPSQQSLEIFYTNAKSLALWNNIFKKTEFVRKEKIFKPRIRLVSNILRKYKKVKCDKLVEIGSGYGWFCELAKKKKMAKKIVAIEPFSLYAKACRKIKGIEVIESTIEKYMKNDNKLNADLIVNFELLSLLFNPRSFLEYCFKGLRSGGMFIGSTANFHGLDIQILKEKSDHFDPNFLNLFTPKSIKVLLNSIGFRKIEVITPGLLDIQIVINKIRSGNIKSENHPFFNMLIEHGNEELIKELQNLLQKYKMSSHMVVSAQK